MPALLCHSYLALPFLPCFAMLCHALPCFACWDPKKEMVNNRLLLARATGKTIV
jgi:hypothetical protein